MFGKRRRDHGGQKDQQRGTFIGNMKNASTMVSVAFMILLAPDIYHLTSGWVWDFLSFRYPPQVLPLVFAGFYIPAMLAAFFLTRAGWATSSGMAILWVANTFI